MISSRRNPRIQDIRRVRRCKGSRALLEGEHLVREALRSGLVPEIVLLTPDARARPEMAELLSGLEAAELLEVSPDVLQSTTDARSPSSIACVLQLPRPLLGDLSPREGLWIYVDGLQDPGNLGALARVAEAVGVRALCLGPGSAHPNHPRALRASAGSLLRLPCAREVSPRALRDALPHLPWIGLEAHGGIDPFRSPLPASAVLALGAEGPGLSLEAQELVTTTLTIPLRAPLESLNATVAAALVLFELRRQGGGAS